MTISHSVFEYTVLILFSNTSMRMQSTEADWTAIQNGFLYVFLLSGIKLLTVILLIGSVSDIQALWMDAMNHSQDANI